MKKLLNIPPLFEFYRGRVYITYFFLRDFGLNPNFNNDPWENLEYRQVFFGFDPSVLGWFGTSSFYYDGSFMIWFSLFGFTIGHSVVYDFQSLSETPSAFIPPGALPQTPIPQTPTPPSDFPYWFDTRSGALMIKRNDTWQKY